MGFLIESQNLLSKKLRIVNLDSEHVMDEFVRVNSKMDLVKLENDVMEKKKILKVEHVVKTHCEMASSINYYASLNLDKYFS